MRRCRRREADRWLRYDHIEGPAKSRPRLLCRRRPDLTRRGANGARCRALLSVVPTRSSDRHRNSAGRLQRGRSLPLTKMRFLGSILVAVLLQPSSPARGEERKLRCIDYQDYKNHPSARSMMLRWRTVDSGRRLEQLWLFPDGEVLFTVGVLDVGSLECRRQLSLERVAAFKSEVMRAR